MQKTKIHTYTSYNFIDKVDETENEDSVQYTESDDSMLCLTLADGAGGSGIFNRKWSKHLTENPYMEDLVEKATLDNWFSSVAEAFYNQITEDKNQFTDRFIENKFNEEGSFATYLQVNINPKENTVTYFGYGDTRLFLFRWNSDVNTYFIHDIYPIKYCETLQDFPDLLNWNRAVESWPEPCTQSLMEGDVIISATDGMADFLVRKLYTFDKDALTSFISDAMSNFLKEEHHEVQAQSPQEIIVTIQQFFEQDNTQKITTIENWMNHGLIPDDITLTYYIHQNL